MKQRCRVEKKVQQGVFLLSEATRSGSGTANSAFFLSCRTREIDASLDRGNACSLTAAATHKGRSRRGNDTEQVSGCAGCNLIPVFRTTIPVFPKSNFDSRGDLNTAPRAHSDL
jgi:hypothetical protein